MSEIKTLEIPKWGLSMEEGTVAQWLIEEGTSFKKGDEICEIETTKIVNVLEAPFDGTLRQILAHAGDTLPVGGLIAICAEADISDSEIQNFAQNLNSTQTTNSSADAKVTTDETVEVDQSPAMDSPSQPQSIVETKPKTAPKDGVVIPAALQGFKVSDVFATPHALKLAEKHNIDLSQVTGTGRLSRISVQDLQSAVQAVGGQWAEIKRQGSNKAMKSTADDHHIAATPVARRLAQKWGINLNDCRASGTRGRVCKEDVEAVYYREHPVAETASTVSCSETLVETNPVKPVPMNAMRKAIASRLQLAKRNAPHFRLSIEVNVEALQSLRKQINDTVPQLKLSINDMLIKAAAAALIKVPEVNVQYDEEKQQILQFKDADISVAVAIDNGLITPIVKAANQKSLATISGTMRDLATRAKTGKLQPDEFQGGSFSISNLGMLGIKNFDAIINPPQGAIMALGSSEARAVVEQDLIVIRQMMTVTLSCDHRVIDGALGAKFLASFKQFVENPALILV